MSETVIELPMPRSVLAASMAAAVDGNIGMPELLEGLNAITSAENPFPEVFMRQCEGMLDAAKSSPVTNQLEAEAMGELIREATTMGKALDSRRKEVTVHLDNAKKTIMGWVQPLTGNLADTITIGKQKIGDWQAAERRKAEAIQRELERKAAEERRRQAEAEAAARAKAEDEARKLREQAEAERQAGNEEKAAKLEVRAEAKEEAGEEKANFHAAEAAATVAPVVSTSAQKISGISGREVWKVEITNPTELIRYIGAHPEHHGLLKIDEGALNRLAGVYKGGFTMPGCKVRSETVIAAKGKK